MKKRFSEEQIIGFLREAEAGMAKKVSGTIFISYQKLTGSEPLDFFDMVSCL